ncbi:MAG: glutamine-synthetase adenylyltransferase [Roseobacter sp.]
MSLCANITRVPRPFDIEKGRSIVSVVPDITPAFAELLVGTAGCSPYLARLIEIEADWLSRANADVDTIVASELDALETVTAADVPNALRQAKRRVALIAALGDLGGAWTLQQVTGALTALADAACQTALKAAIGQQIARGKLPGMTEDDIADAAGMVVLAMGKMGAGELNYSSDIDLICLFDETRFTPDTFHDARSAFARATRAMSAMLSEITDQGYVFRTDLRLRPDPAVTPVCIAMDAAEQYYESLGRTWERAAYIKARAAAGDTAAGGRFLKTLTPFVWRRHLDFAAIQDAHDMRLAIREHKGLGGPITLPGHNMKLGRGGIREIEFFTQTRQLIAGGRDPDLRCRGTLEGLSVLADKLWIDRATASELSEHYTAHRTIEHRLQMVRDAQTHSLPNSDEGFARLAAMMDRDVGPLKSELTDRLVAVHELTEGFFAPSTPDLSATTSDLDASVIAGWISYPALRSARSRQVFERVKPDLLSRLSRTARPQEALRAFDGFLAGLPAGVQLFSLLEANPHLTDLIIDVSGTSPALAQYLSRNAGVFDAVIGGSFFTDWPSQDDLAQTLEKQLAPDNDYEQHLDTARLWYKEWHFRIGVHLLRGLTSAEDASAQYSDLACVVLRVLWPVVTTHFEIKHGPPPGRGAVVLGMGSLGAHVLNAKSDLDLIVIYDPLGEDISTGKKQLTTRLYYAKLTKSLITALSAPMAQGKLFEVDMRLRPSGNKGPVATSWAAFQSYQQEQAWVWEHLALTRAQVVAGPAEFGTDVATFLTGLLSQARDKTAVMQEVAMMRKRIQAAKPATGFWDVKVGPGRLQEIELLAQAGALLGAEGPASTTVGLDWADRLGVLDSAETQALKQAATLYGQVHVAVRLLSDKSLTSQDIGLAARGFLAQTMSHSSFDSLERTLADSYRICNGILDKVLAHFDEDTSDAKG